MEVLFVCRGNVARSQIAEGFFNHYSISHRATSCGTSAERYSSSVVSDFAHISDSMNEIGIDISNQKPKQISRELVDGAQKIISMSQESLPDYVNGKDVFYWNVQDPASTSYDFHCEVRDEIGERVKGLLKELE